MNQVTKTAGDFFIVDNSEENWKALKYVREWCQISKAIDIATGYFEVGALLRLDGEWQKVEKFRILIGSETSRATIETIRQAQEFLAKSAEAEAIEDPFLTGLEAVIAAIRSGQIEIRVFKQKKFHAKTYITHGKLDIVGSAALVGSSNFTPAGLTKNIELNVRFTGPEVRELQEWFETFWEMGEDVKPEILDVLETYEHKYRPIEIYAKSLSMLTKDLEPGATEWETSQSKIFPKLAPYQREAYHGLKQRAAKWRGAFLTDGVGLGKTFVGLMLAEYFAVKERKKVLILATKTGVDSVWMPELKENLRHLTGSFASIEVMAHTDFSRADALDRATELAERVDVIIIDEAHNFRNRGSQGDDLENPKSRWWRLQKVASSKMVFNLTATPINNSLFDFVHQVEIFSGMADDHFASIGIPHLRQHIQSLENAFQEAESGAQGSPLRAVDVQDFQSLVKKSPLLKELIVQNSRDYAVKSALAIGDTNVKFPKTALPRAVPYEYTSAFEELLSILESSFQKSEPLFVLPMYYPLAFARNPELNRVNRNRQAQVVALIRTTFLKRFESSIAAFAGSSSDLAVKIASWISKYSSGKPEIEQAIEAWRKRVAPTLSSIHENFRPGIEIADLDFEDDADPFEIENVGELNDEEYRIDEMIESALEDLEQLTMFMESCVKVGHANDDKIHQLVKLLAGEEPHDPADPVFDPVIKNQKVLVFTEYADTARYIENRLKIAGLQDLDRIDGSRKSNRHHMVQRFAPFYNKVSVERRNKLDPLRVLVSTDVLSEGVNLQDASIIVNYDIHWNPVRLMQRIGRVDRRLNTEIEASIVQEDPSQVSTRGQIFIRNFLPPKSLNRLLSLYSRVQGRALRISTTLGIPGGRLLNENDVLDDVKLFESFEADYRGQISFDEKLRLHYLDLIRTNPELETIVNKMPVGSYSSKPGEARALFECSLEPVRVAESGETEAHWSLEEGRVRWSMQLSDGSITHDLEVIDSAIRSEPGTSRLEVIEKDEVRAQLKTIRREQLQQLGRAGMPLEAPKPRSICWMEIQ